MRRSTIALAGIVTAGLGVLFTWGLASTAPDEGRVNFVVSFVGLMANVIMAFAAVWAFRSWRNQITGESLHALAMDVITWARKVELSWHRAIDLWKLLSTVEENQLEVMTPHIAALGDLQHEIPTLVARLEGLHGGKAARALHALNGRLEALKMGMLLDREKRARRGHADDVYEPQASIMRAHAGYFDLDGAKGRVSEIVELLAQWARPHLGVDHRSADFDEARLHEIVRRDEAQAKQCIAAAENETNPSS